MTHETKLLLLLGVSGVGKTTVIKHLCKLNERLVYVGPYTTRQLRPGERDKIQVSRAEMESMVRENQILWLNEIYGEKYGTPKSKLSDIRATGAIPLIDWPVQRVALVRQSFPEGTTTVYLRPPDVDELRRRLCERDIDQSRIGAILDELRRFDEGEYDQHIDLKIVNGYGMSQKVAERICSVISASQF